MKASAENNIAIKVSGLTKKFDSRAAVDNVSFELPRGAFLCVFGPNGAGKTTLLRMLATLLRPSAGNIEINGEDIKENPEAARASIGLISHAPMVYPNLTAQENLEFFAKLYGVSNPHERSLEMLRAVKLETRRLDLAKTFSRGMTQRLSIARAFIHRPSIVLLDEPYSGLDVHAASVFDTLIQNARQACTFVMVSHNLEKGFEMASHALLLEGGRVVNFNTKSNLDYKQLCAMFNAPAKHKAGL